MSARRRPRRRAAGRRGCPVLVAALAFLPLGCQTMTQARLRELDTLYSETIRKIQEGWAKQMAQEELAQEVDRARAERADLYNLAAERLAAGDASGALENVETALAPVKVKRPVAPAGGDAAAAGQAAAAQQPAANAQAAPAATEEILVEPRGMTGEERGRLLALKGMALVELERAEEGLQAFQAAIAADPGNLAARRGLGRVHFHARRFREAVEAWKPVLAAGARDADLLAMVGEARQELARAGGGPEELLAAKLAFEQVVLERPEDSEAVRRLATLAYESGAHAEAILYLNTARAQVPFAAEDLERLGNSYLGLGDKVRALDYLELAAAMRPPTPELARALGELHIEARVPGRAAEWLARACKQMPAEAPPEERYRIGTLYADGGRLDDAVQWLGAIGETEPRYPEAQARLVLLHRAAGRDDEALAAHERVRRLPGAFGEAHAAAGALHLRRQELEPALEAFARAAALPESKVEGLAGLAEVAYARGHLDGALQYYRRALEFRPGDARINAAVEQVARAAALASGKPRGGRPAPAE